jgi:hypothetical protein
MLLQERHDFVLITLLTMMLLLFPILRLLAGVSYLSPRAQQRYKNLAERLLYVAPDGACFRPLL